MTDILGRKVVHEKLSYDAMRTRWIEKIGMEEDFATVMTRRDQANEAGAEEKWAKEPGVSLAEWSKHGNAKIVVGKKTLREVIAENRSVLNE